ncbi:MAG: ABC-type spermidine/putrescine transport system, permease component II [Haloquadratum sp. J07HQX50]|jgi:ABC-type spermidine/putrescine transport system, permease component II|nr:MAG: ABC-type spermidine/putrescine transport system, permease component II [Haloquadratum sp. J07HQX50]
MSVSREQIGTAAFRFGYIVIFSLLLLPLVIVIATSFSSSGNLQFPPQGFSFQWYSAFFTDIAWLRAFDNSIIVGVGTTILATIMGLTAAFGVETHRGRASNLLTPIVILPLLVPPVILGVTLLVYFSRLGIRSSYFAVILAHSLWATPLVFFVMQSVLQRFDWQLHDAGMDLGANPIRVFIYVVLPNVKSGVFVAALLGFIVSLQEFVMALFLSNYQTQTIPVLAWSSLRQSLTPTVSVVSTFLILISFVGLVSAMIAINIEFIAKRL